MKGRRTVTGGSAGVVCSGWGRLAFLGVLFAAAPSHHAVAREVKLRDSIGVNNAMTNGNFMFDALGGPGGNGGDYAVIIAAFSATENVILKEVRAVVTTSGGPPDWGWDYSIQIWDTAQSAINSPLDGNVGGMTFDLPTQGPTLFGSTGNWVPFGVMNTYEVRFNIESLGLQVLAGQTRLIALTTYSSFQQIAIMESQEMGPSDIAVASFMQPGEWVYLSDTPPSLHDGRLAIEITAETLEGAVPTISTWGLFTLTLATLIAGTLVIRNANNVMHVKPAALPQETRFDFPPETVLCSTGSADGGTVVLIR